MSTLSASTTRLKYLATSLGASKSTNVDDVPKVVNNRRISGDSRVFHRLLYEIISRVLNIRVISADRVLT